jgi:hypothetical protein
MKAYGEVEVTIDVLLTSALVGGEWSASRPCRFTPGERTLGTHWIGGWVGPRAGLDDVVKRKFLTLPGLELRPLGLPARSQSLYRLSYPGSSIKSGNLLKHCFFNTTCFRMPDMRMKIIDASYDLYSGGVLIESGPGHSLN